MNTLQKIGSFLGEKLSEVYHILKAHVNDRWNPHQVTKEQVGLGNADNTSDLDKPVSTAQQAALDGKIDREEGKELMPSPGEGLGREYYLNASGRWEKISSDAMVITMTVSEDKKHFSLDEEELGAYLKAYYGVDSYEEERNPDAVHALEVYLKYAPYGVHHKEDGTVDNINTIWLFLKVCMTSTEYGIPHLIAREFNAEDDGLTITQYYCQIDIWDGHGTLKPEVLYSSITEDYVAFKSYVDGAKSDLQAHINDSSIHQTAAEIMAGMGSGVIVIPADFTKEAAAMEAEMIQAVQERLNDGTLFKKPVYLLYSWKEDYISPDAPVFYSIGRCTKEVRSKRGNTPQIRLYFNSSIEVTESEAPETRSTYCVVITVLGNRVTISYQDYEDEHPVEGIYLTEDENGLINLADKSWDELYTELQKDNRPQVSLKTLSSGMYCPASYEFTLNDETAQEPVYSGTLEISYVKETDGVRELWVETRVFSDFAGSTGSYSLDSYLKKYPLNTGNKPLNIIAESGERVVYDGSSEISVQIPQIGRSVQLRGLNEHGYWEVDIYNFFRFEMDLVGVSAENAFPSIQKVYYEEGKWRVENDYSLTISPTPPNCTFPINMISHAERGYYRWMVYYWDRRTLLSGILYSDVALLHVVGDGKSFAPIDPIAFCEGYELYNPLVPDEEDKTAGAYFKLYGFTEAVTGKLMKYADTGWMENSSVFIEYPYAYADISVAGTYKIVLTDEGENMESDEFRVKERNRE